MEDVQIIKKEKARVEMIMTGSLLMMP